MNLVSDRLRVGLVDPSGDGELGRRRRLADEPFGVPLVAGVEHDRPGGVHPLGVAVVAARSRRRVPLAAWPAFAERFGGRGVCRLCGMGIARSQRGFIAAAALG